jgi:hypothetical protein
VRREQSEIKRKLTREQNWSNNVLRTSGEIRRKCLQALVAKFQKFDYLGFLIFLRLSAAII